MKRGLIPIFLSAIGLLASMLLQAQGKWSDHLSIHAGYYRGSFITTAPKAEYIRDSYTSLAEVAISFQSTGTKDWQLRHNLPSWGISLLHGNTGSKKFVGDLTSLYLFMNLPLIRSGKYTGSLKAGAGPGFMQHPYDINTNPKNTLIGTTLNAFLNLVVLNEYKISDHLSINAGVSFMHLSNGGTTLPNLGLNTPGFTAGIRYTPNMAEEIITRKPSEPFKSETVIRVQTSLALRQASRVGGNHYLINVVQGEAGKRTAPNHYFGAGLQLTYNRSLDYAPSESPLNPTHPEKFQAGIYAAYEHHFGRLSFPFHIGFYLYNKNLYPVIFQQYGARLQFSRHWNGTIMLKSHLGQADFIHTGIGYKF